mmetsp:Transcript_33625/g.70702  ORF Transcript_33625/g.70702 Transcript_33625/m.70702 type:complete len:80 (-) Transcript_33625:76-315(-)
MCRGILTLRINELVGTIAVAVIFCFIDQEEEEEAVAAHDEGEGEEERYCGRNEIIPICIMGSFLLFEVLSGGETSNAMD